MRRKTGSSDVNLQNTHFWNEGKFFYCHNGSFPIKEAKEFDVDSQIIGKKINESGPWGAVEFCQKASFANVFIVNIESGEVFFSRSKANTVFTDGFGQYSTTLVEDVCDVLVPLNTVHMHKIELYTPITQYQVGAKWNQEKMRYEV